MAVIKLRRDEGLALLVALAAHLGLVAVLTLRPTPIPLPPPERISVTLSDDVALTSTSPSVAPAAAEEAPELGEEVVPPPPAPIVQPAPAPAPKPLPRATSAPPPAKTVAAKVPPAKPAAPAAKASPAKVPPAKPSARPGASRIGDDFLKGSPAGTAKTSPGPQPAAAIGPGVRSALLGQIVRQIRPKWQGRVPQGLDTEKLVTILAWDLNPDGSLTGNPRLVGQEGVTAANSAQAQRHKEEAIRAVRLAAPFNLPEELYPAWKRIATFRFDRKLSQ